MNDSVQNIKIANLLELPSNIQAILWDMDGVLIDSLGLDVIICNKLVQKHIDSNITLSRDYIRSIFAYDVPTFIKLILEKIQNEYKIPNALEYYDQILEEYNTARQSEPFPVNPGINEILKDAKEKGLKQAIVSNNPTADVQEILDNCEIENVFDEVIGNDVEDGGKELQKKPAPDFYLLAAKKLDVEPKNCAVVEDSTIGTEAGYKAGCYVIGVATGSADTDELKESKTINIFYKSFENGS